MGNKEKRRETFNWLPTKRFSLYLLQEAHSTNNIMQQWTPELGYQALFSCYKRNKAEVGTLFNILISPSLKAELDLFFR